jgi:hypothetical protein
MSKFPLSREGEAPDVETASADYAKRFSGPAGRYLLSVQERAVRRVLSLYSGGTLLELGGGHGQLLPLYEALDMQVTLHGSELVCFDGLAGAGFERVERLNGPYLDLGLPAGSFDVVLAIRLVMHEPEWSRLLAEMCRLARQAVIIDYPSTRSLNALEPLLFGAKKRLEGNTRHYLSFKRADLAQVLAASGFARITEERQFFLPMVVHRKLGANAVLRGLEHLFRAVRLTRLLGSPVILRAERDAAGSG